MKALFYALPGLCIAGVILLALVWLFVSWWDYAFPNPNAGDADMWGEA